MTEPLPRQLAALRRAAPPTLLPAVLAATGTGDLYCEIEGPIGPVYVAFNRHGVSMIELAGAGADFESGFTRRLGRPAHRTDTVPAALEDPLRRALAEGRPGRLPIDLRRVTPFQAGVLRKTAEIPRGEVRPYSWLATEVGRPGAHRAAATAVARNPVPLIVPCHRVVRLDGQLGGYSLGSVSNKRRLLEAEGVDVEGLTRLASRGIRLVGSATGRVYCHPTCRHARRIEPSHRAEFRTAAEAEEKGRRPCSHCRPRGA